MQQTHNLNTYHPAVLTLLLVVLLLTAIATAQVQSSALAFETEALDLETGEVIDLLDPVADGQPADFHFAYNADRAIHALSLQAALSPKEPGGPVQVAARPGAADSLLVMADGAVGRELPTPGLSTEAHRAIRSYIERDLYGVRRTVAGPLDGGALEGANPAQAYSTRFTQEGIYVQPQGGDSELSLTLSGWGYGEALLPVAPTSPRADGQRVEYVRGALTEWYVNRSSGLEQGFTLVAPPPGVRGEARLRLEMTLSGALVAEASNGSILFRDISGRTRLRYRGLKAWDATGRQLTAEMKLAENRLTLDVDDLRAVYPVTVDPTFEAAKLVASDGAAVDFFGSSVAASGSTVVIGARFDANNGRRSGSAYVFTEPVGGWSGTLTEDAKLVPSDGADDFGYSVAVSGSTVVVGAERADDNGFASGSAYVFTEPVGGWSGTLTEDAKLLASDNHAGARLGCSVAVSGSTVFAGARVQSEAGEYGGAVYVFREPVGGWAGTLTEAAKLVASDRNDLDELGNSVAVSGSTVVAGAPRDDDNGDASGSAYVFTEPVGGWSGTLTEDAKLLASDGTLDAWLGSGVAISGSTLVVGARADDDNGDDSGSAYVFTEPVGGWSGTLTEDAKLLASDGAAGDSLGWSVAVSGSTLVVGAWADDDNGDDSGSAYVFTEPVGGWSGTFTEDAKLLASDGALDAWLGYGVAITGSTVVVSAPGDDDYRGSVYVFQPLSPEEQIEILIGDVEELVTNGTLNAGQGNSLIVKSEAAIQKLQQGNITAAIGQLMASINQVSGLINAGVLTSAEGEALITAANSIIDEILAG